MELDSQHQPPPSTQAEAPPRPAPVDERAEASTDEHTEALLGRRGVGETIAAMRAIGAATTVFRFYNAGRVVAAAVFVDDPAIAAAVLAAVGDDDPERE